MHAAIAAPVSYLPEYLHEAPLRVLGALIWALGRRPFAALLLQFAGGPPARSDGLADPPTGPGPRAGRDLPDAVRHLHAHFLHTPASVVRYARIADRTKLELFRPRQGHLDHAGSRAFREARRRGMGGDLHAGRARAIAGGL